MALNASTTLPYDAATVLGVFTDEGFVRHMSEYVGGTLESLTVDGDTSGAFTVTAVRTMPTRRLPDMARKFVGETLSVTQTEEWSAPAADGSREATVRMTVANVPLTVAAVQRLISQGDSTVVDLQGNVTSSIPFLGGKIAGAAEPMIGKALNVQATEARAWLENH
ncbi:DUF2505 domain-containing protein [Arthrobacter agilis]|uniref:DUF2505 domain-containing protein n=1 Tax=Arthrobacter agilis TaxID=37921 RepID=UPI000B350BF7|nr:DUF2505 domain-containing protein [Arthrobacter agilis]OUM40470.1 proteinase inhibitor I25 cystatin [Arthrobacter agilis]PPB45083.1 DUF2505 domain-containing protein [Arthrobacter agilis]TPV27787.1 DUF2505 domain-containing protein [Arthrobacter agilis]VDR31559.1 Protein of uncharacterised function (DUF2505) [Arthrobacter agilis]